MPPFRRGADVPRPRRDAALRRGRERPTATALAPAPNCFVPCGAAVPAPFPDPGPLGRVRHGRAGAGVVGFAEGGFPRLPALLASAVVAAPASRIAPRLLVPQGFRPPARPRVPFRRRERLGPWAVPEAFPFGALVSRPWPADLAAVGVGQAAHGPGSSVLASATADATPAPQAVREEAPERRDRAGADRVAARPPTRRAPA